MKRTALVLLATWLFALPVTPVARAQEGRAARPPTQAWDLAGATVEVYKTIGETAFLVSLGHLDGEPTPGFFDQRYGGLSPRVAFRSVWSDAPHRPFDHRTRPTFHRLRTTLDALYSRCEQPVSLAPTRPIRVTVKLRADSEVSRNLVRVGLKTKSHGAWAFGIGSAESLFGKTGWHVVANAANPLEEKAPLAGFDNRDWHTFVLMIPDEKGPAKLYCDGQYVMDLRTSISDAQRDKVREAQNHLHGSRQQLVPETGGDEDYVFLESRYPGQVIDVDRVEVSQRPLATSRASLPVLLDLDWQLDGMRIVENAVQPHAASPLIRKSAAPEPIGFVAWDEQRKRYARHEATAGWPNARVFKGEAGFHLYVHDVYEEISKAAGRVTFCTYHVGTSKDGLAWNLTSPKLVVPPGAPGSWDSGTTYGVPSLKENGIFRMWYEAYTTRLQQGRTAYAVSHDGIHWERPKLGLFPWNGADTNICFSLQPGPTSSEYELVRSVVRADEAAPERRYVMFLHTQGPHGFIVDVATSPDGLRWKRAPHNSRRYGFESPRAALTIHHTPKIHHEPHYWWGFAGYASHTGEFRHDFFGWVVEPEEKENVGFGLWRSRGRKHEIHGKIIPVGDEWWIYYTADGDLCLGTVGRHQLYGLALRPDEEYGGATSIALRAPADGFESRQLMLNVSGLETGSDVRAELLDATTGEVLSGYGLDQAMPIQRNAVETPLAWKSGGSRLPKLTTPVSVRLRVTRGDGTPQIHALYLRKK